MYPIQQTTPTETLRFAAKTEDEQREWVRVLSSFCAANNKTGSDASSEKSTETKDSSNSAVAAVAEADAFWKASFGDATEVPWPQFIHAYEDTVHCDTEADGTGAAFYCIANVISQGRLSQSFFCSSCKNKKRM